MTTAFERHQNLYSRTRSHVSRSAFNNVSQSRQAIAAQQADIQRRLDQERKRRYDVSYQRRSGGYRAGTQYAQAEANAKRKQLANDQARARAVDELRGEEGRPGLNDDDPLTLGLGLSVPKPSPGYLPPRFPATRSAMRTTPFHDARNMIQNERAHPSRTFLSSFFRRLPAALILFPSKLSDGTLPAGPVQDFPVQADVPMAFVPQGLSRPVYDPVLEPLVAPAAPGTYYKSPLARPTVRGRPVPWSRPIPQRMPIGIPFSPKPGTVIIPFRTNPGFKTLPSRQPRSRPGRVGVQPRHVEKINIETRRGVPARLPDVAIQFERTGIRIRRARYWRTRYPRKADRKSNGFQMYSATLMFINKTFGNVGEIVDFIEALLNAVLTEDGKQVVWTWDGSYGLTPEQVVQGVIDGRFTFHPGEAIINLAIEGVIDKLSGLGTGISKQMGRPVGVGFGPAL